MLCMSGALKPWTLHPGVFMHLVASSQPACMPTTNGNKLTHVCTPDAKIELRTLPWQFRKSAGWCACKTMQSPHSRTTCKCSFCSQLASVHSVHCTQLAGSLLASIGDLQRALTARKTDAGRQTDRQRLSQPGRHTHRRMDE